MTSQVINKQTLIPLGIAVSVGMALLVLVWKIGRYTATMESQGRELAIQVKNQIDSGNQIINARLDKIEDRLETRWTIEFQAMWETEFKQRNPTIEIPNAYEVIRRNR